MRVAAAIAEEAPPDAGIQAEIDEGLSDFGKFIATYPYESAEPGDLNFEAGETIHVVKQDGDWWTGVIGNRSGIFPANYVVPIDEGQPTGKCSKIFFF